MLCGKIYSEYINPVDEKVVSGWISAIMRHWRIPCNQQVAHILHVGLWIHQGPPTKLEKL